MKFIEMKNVVVFVIALLFSYCLHAIEYGKFYYAFKDKIEIVNVPNKITIKVDTNTIMDDYEMFLKSILKDIKIE